MTWKKKGNRIRASDKSLVYHFCIGWLLLLFVVVFLLLNLRQLLFTDWKDFNLLHAGITWTAYNSITVLIATGVCALVAFLYYRYGYDSIKRLLHRQKLARMVLENKWYEAENTKDSGFFTDLQSRSREKIVWFPKIYYQMDNGLLHILCEITMGKYQEQLLSLEDKLESGLYCELINKTLHDGYIKYTLRYDMIANRISIDEVIAENGGLRLMKNLVWEYDSLPHALICGGTGGGKTYEQYIKLDISIEEAPIKNRFEIRLKNERAYYAVRDLLTYYDIERTAFSIINRYVRFVDKEADKKRSDWKLSVRWTWFIGENREPLKLTTKPEPYTLDRTLRWIQRQVDPTLKMLETITAKTGIDYLKEIRKSTKLTEKHYKIIEQQTTSTEDVILEKEN